MQLAADGVMLLAIGLLLGIAWHDFGHFTIHNRAVLVLLVLYLAWAALTGFASLAGDLAAGLILFLPGFAMWLLRLMGAGDVKLYFGLGLFMGMPGLGLFAALLLAVSVLFLLLLHGAARLGTGRLPRRMKEIRASGKAPYAVIMCSAAIPVMLVRLIANA